MALPTATESVRIFFIRASGANGCPLRMPIDAYKPTVSGSTQSAGSFCTTVFSSS